MTDLAKIRAWAARRAAVSGEPLAGSERGSQPSPSEATVIDIETTGRRPWDSELLCVGVGNTAYRAEEGRARARAVLAQPGIVVAHTAFDLRYLALDGAVLHPDLQFHDTRVMSWLLDENGSHALDDLCERWLDFTPPKVLCVRGGRVMFETRSGELVPSEDAPWGEMAAYNESDLRATAALYDKLVAELKSANLWGLFLRHEVPLGRCLLGVEVVGLPFNEGNRAKLQRRVARERGELQVALLAEAALPASFNLGSATQVGAYLFGRGMVALKDRVEVPPVVTALVKQAKANAKTTDGIETDAAVIANASGQLPATFVAEKVGRVWAHGHWEVKGRALAEAEAGFGSSSHWKDSQKEHARPSTSSISLVLKNPHDRWVADFVLWRELSKLESAFLAKFPTYLKDGRLHGTINRCGTATGRFSSSAPNLQQIPAHGAYGKHVRALFEGPLVVGDYSQLEQRIAAHYSEDANLLRAYTEGIDLYGLAASILFGGEPLKSHPQRGLMKTGMLALQYGAGSGKLAQLMLIDGHLDATRDQAENLIEQLRAVFSRFFEWREEVISLATKRGYVETLGGRRRRLDFPEGWSQRRGRSFGGMTREEVSRAYAMERQAINAVCQGGAADVVARAMVESERRLGSAATLLVQVHDEILWQREAGWTAEHLAVVREACETGHGFTLQVPLEFDAKEVSSWAEKGGGISNMSNLFSERMKRERVDSSSEGLQSRKASSLSRARA